ncbi:LON peptidase substrate-binding domain-containing protein [Shimia sp. MMG029]|uniref:LON peptidase substrate-binding domain-containing protein n=1 Tax=Shimia sp. MMG029 TaxID=3021978 RepID=UPI0022FF0FC0|nr:LON peptidase substrate-binding domain-containing protein [Shimia sp. MMG029]MDA5556548.1 LON peptidase substrate-binding domain-containing protein [Shimia sp. MMG029]
MFKAADLPETLAVFPLPGALMLPRARLPLHIFEPRYLAMLDDALKTPERLIGMIQPNEVPGREGSGLHTIGCAGRITQFTETDDNRYLITLSGISRFRVLQEVEGFAPYRRCQVQWDGFERDLGGTETDPGFQRPAFMDLLQRYFEQRDLSTDWETLKDADDELLINSLSMLLEFGAEDKQALLEAPSLTTRRETLVTLMEFSLRSGDGEDLIQ